MKQPLVLPMALYVFSIWGLALFMFLSRVKSIKAGLVSIKYFRAYDGAPPPDKVVVAGQHYDNQFQVPILFLITCSLHIVLGSVTTVTLALAWAFVLTRVAHSWVHLGSNNVRHRAASFAAGWLMIGLLWLQLLLASF